MDSSVSIEYNDTSVIIDCRKVFLSFDRRYAAKGYPIPCEIYFKPTTELIGTIGSSGIVTVDEDFSRYSQRENIYRILLIPTENYNEEKMIDVLSKSMLLYAPN